MGRVPTCFDLDSMQEAVAECDLEVWSVDDMQQALAYVGRNAGPHLLDVMADRLPTPVVTGVVGSVWSMAEWPLRLLPERRWRTLFARAGYTVTGPDGGGRLADRPSAPMRLYRGTQNSRGANGWSWTTSRDVAEWFATRWEVQGYVWRALVPPQNLLAEVAIREELEYVVDPAGLEPTLAMLSGQVAVA